MKKKIIAAILVSARVLAACGQPTNGPIMEENSQESSQESSVSEPSVTEESSSEEKEDLPMITERVVKDGKMQSYLSGEWLDEEIVKRRPIAIMIPNNPPAMPQYGLSKASIIYEAPVEGRITRLMGVFED